MTTEMRSIEGLAWQNALFLFKRGEPDKLGALLRDPAKTPPADVREFLADVVTGQQRLPARDTRIRIKHETRNHIHGVVLALGHSVAYGAMTPARARRMKNMEIARLASEIGAEASSVRKTWLKYERQHAKSFKQTAEIVRWSKAEERGYATTSVRMGRKVKTES